MKIANLYNESVVVTFDNGDTYALNEDGSVTPSIFKVGSISTDNVVFDSGYTTHPLSDAKVGEWWEVTYSSGIVTVECIETNRNYTGVASARQVYVLPKAEADEKVGLTLIGYGESTANSLLNLLGLAL